MSKRRDHCSASEAASRRDPAPKGSALALRQSPLWMVTRQPSVNRLVRYLDQQRVKILEANGRPQRLEFSRRRLDDVRSSFARTLLVGEARLHHLCELLADALLDSRFRLRSTVVARDPSTDRRFTLVRDLTRDELYTRNDLDLGTAQLDSLCIGDASDATRAELVANFVEYEALATNPAGALRLISRIKAEEEIWNKVVDEIFGLDQLVRRDKQLRHLSPFVKDVFGIKIVVADDERPRKLQIALENLLWDQETLERHGLGHLEGANELAFLEVKDYLSQPHRKASGWQAIKSVARWSGLHLEIQIQSLRNHHLERSAITSESHEAFKARREALRQQVAERVPLFGFYRDLLHWLFCSPDGDPPSFDSVVIELRP